MSESPNEKDLLKETNPDIDRKYTYGDYIEWTDDKRYELINGVVYMMVPAPAPIHQEVLGNINRYFSNYLADKECKVYFAPFDVRFPDVDEGNEDITTVVQPDLLVVCDKDKLDDKGCKGAPDLIVEVVSPGSGGRDRKIKRDLYEKYGVKEYWLVDYQEKTIEVYTQKKEDNEYGKSDVYVEGDILTVGLFNDLEIEIDNIFT
ncbi:MAG: Uma2 family endonuclease [Bacillota bacterium]